MSFRRCVVGFQLYLCEGESFWKVLFLHVRILCMDVVWHVYVYPVGRSEHMFTLEQVYRGGRCVTSVRRFGAAAMTHVGSDYVCPWKVSIIRRYRLEKT